MGGMIGGNLAGGLASSLFGGGSSQQQPQQQTYGPQQSYGNQLGSYMGNNLNKGFNQYMPQQLQGQTFGNAGGALGGYFGNKLGMGELGSAIGNSFNPYIQKYIPQNMRDVQMGNLGGYLGSQFGQGLDNGFMSRGMIPYQIPNYGNSMTGSSYSSGNPSYYGGVPEAPAAGDLYSRAPGGYSASQSYGNVPAAPPLGNMYDRGSSFNSYQMQEPSQARNALLSDIRNFRRNPSQQQQPFGNVPEAPPLGDLYSNLPSNSSRFGIQSGFSNRSPAQNMLSEFRDRASQPGMGLRSAQTRTPSAYPSNEGNSMMDLLRNRLGNIRQSVEPNDYPRNYTVMGV